VQVVPQHVCPGGSDARVRLDVDLVDARPAEIVIGVGVQLIRSVRTGDHERTGPNVWTSRLGDLGVKHLKKESGGPLKSDFNVLVVRHGAKRRDVTGDITRNSSQAIVERLNDN